MTQCHKIYVEINRISRKHQNLFPDKDLTLCGGIHMEIFEKKLEFSSSAQLN